jgi:TPR repeat protein
MNIRPLIVACVSIFLVSSNVQSQDYYKGMEALKNGDYETALRELEPLAKQGNGNAQFNLGLMYDIGKGVIRNYKEAAKWYRKGAEQGGRKSQYNLGVMYLNGRGVDQDHREAFKLFHVSSENGLPEAQHNLGLAYLLGRGVTPNGLYGYMWLHLAADQGHAPAIQARAIVEDKMSPGEVSAGREFAEICKAKKYSKC